GDHGHVDDDPVAPADALADQYPSEASHLSQEFAIRERPDGSRDRAVVDERRLVGPAVRDVPIEGVVTGVDHAPREPTVERGPRTSPLPAAAARAAPPSRDPRPRARCAPPR